MAIFARWPRSEPLSATITLNPDTIARYSVIARTKPISPDEHLASLLPTNLIAQTDACIQPANSNTPPTPAAIGVIPYEIGHALETATGSREPQTLDAQPRIASPIWHRVLDAYIHDASSGLWYVLGDPPEIDPAQPIDNQPDTAARLGPVRTVDPESYKAAVAEIRTRICEGELFQANIAHPISRTFDGDPRSFFSYMARVTQPRFGVYIEHQHPGSNRTAVCSFSPELFLHTNAATRRVTTRPMKGTRPGEQREQLKDSAKDRAELAMITDLMRNDLGRVCTPGTLRVERARTIEAHATGDATVAQGASQVAGTLRDGVTNENLLQATFPPGSITGAPKIQAMRVITNAERGLGFDTRNAYCGCAGRIDTDGSMQLSVAIRTCTITGKNKPRTPSITGDAVYPAGAGIVADSDPDQEWSETLDKARAFLNAPSIITTGGV